MIIILARCLEGDMVTWYYPRSSVASLQVTSKKKSQQVCILIRMANAGSNMHAFWVKAGEREDGEETWQNLNDYMTEKTSRIILEAVAWRLEEKNGIESGQAERRVDQYGSLLF